MLLPSIQEYSWISDNAKRINKVRISKVRVTSGPNRKYEYWGMVGYSMHLGEDDEWMLYGFSSDQLEKAPKQRLLG